MTTCTVNKVDSNITGLSLAEEVCLKQLPTLAADGFDPTWYAMEPNAYSDFGGDLTTVARQPLSASRQRKKGTVTDLSSGGGFNTDLTKSNLVKWLQGFFFATAREKPATAPLNGAVVPLTSIATSDDSFNAASGLLRFFAGHIIATRNALAANNGRHLVSTVTDVKVTVAENLTDEATPAATASLHAVGFRFAAGIASLTASAAAAVLAITGTAAASGVYTITGATNVAADETVTIGTHVYTFKVTPTAGDQVKIGADKAATLVNLAAAINGSAGAGSLYGVGTVAHTQVSAVAGASIVTVTAKVSGTPSNAIATTEVSTNGAWGSATLTGGAGIGFDTLGLVPGEWVFVGGDLAATQFTQTASTNRPGYARISAVTKSSLTFDDTTWTPQTDAGTGKTLEIFFGTVVRNEPNPADIVTRSVQMERQLGNDDSGLPQSQYIKGCIANEFTLNVPTAEKVTADLKYIGLDDEARTGLEGLKSGARVSALGEDAYNTSLDIYRVRMAVVDPSEMNSDALFGYVQAATVTINNNATPNKALGFLGGFDVSVGNFDASGSITAYFTTVEALKAIRANADIAYNIIAAAGNAGFIFDMPLLGASGGRLNVALNQPVTIPLTPNGAQNSLGYTLLSVWFDYLPDIAMPV